MWGRKSSLLREFEWKINENGSWGDSWILELGYWRNEIREGVFS